MVVGQFWVMLPPEGEKVIIWFQIRTIKKRSLLRYVRSNTLFKVTPRVFMFTGPSKKGRKKTFRSANSQFIFFWLLKNGIYLRFQSIN